jgi:hypothetical protein
MKCLLRLGRRDEAAVIEPQLTLAVAVADVDVSKSCFCARASGPETGVHELRAPGKDGDGNGACCR